MAKIYDKTDLFWSSRGDCYIGPEGDLMDTEYDPLRSLAQEIRTRAEAEPGDWRIFPNIGAGLNQLVGEPNNSQTADLVKIKLQSSLTRDSFIDNKDIAIRYMPIDRDKLLIRLSIKVMPTAKNASSEVLTKSFLYNYSDNNVYFIGV